MHGVTLIKMMQRLKLQIPILAITDYENMPFNLPPQVSLLLQPLSVEQVMEKLNQLDIKILEHLTRNVCFIYEETSKFLDKAGEQADYLFLQNRNAELSLIQLSRHDINYLVFEQAGSLKNSDLLLKIIELELYNKFRKIFILIDGQTMKFLVHKIEKCSNIRVLQSSEFDLTKLD
jgi:hypothetical protein